MGRACVCCGEDCLNEKYYFHVDRYAPDAICFVTTTQEYYEYEIYSQELNKLEDQTTVNKSKDSDLTVANTYRTEIVDTRRERVDGQTKFYRIYKKTTVVRKLALEFDVNDVFDWDKQNNDGINLVNKIYFRLAGSNNKEMSGVNDWAATGFNSFSSFYGVFSQSLPVNESDFDDLLDESPYSFDLNITSNNTSGMDYFAVDATSFFPRENGSFLILLNPKDVETKDKFLDEVDESEVGSLITLGTWKGTLFSDLVWLELIRPLNYKNYPDGTYAGTIDTQIESWLNNYKNNFEYDWHDYFVRLSDGEYESLHTYMDVGINFSRLIASFSYFLYGGKVDIEIFKPKAGNLKSGARESYIEANFDLVYDRLHEIETALSYECTLEDGQPSYQVSSLMDSFLENVDVTTNIDSILSDPCATPENKSFHVVKGNPKDISGVLNPFGGRYLWKWRYLYDGFSEVVIGDYVGRIDTLENVSDSTSFAVHDYYSGTTFNWFIRDCVIETPGGRIDEIGKRLYYSTVPHYGEYQPSSFKIKLIDPPFYPGVLELNAVANERTGNNDICPSVECIGGPAVLEWDVLTESHTDAGTPTDHSVYYYSCSNEIISTKQSKDWKGGYEISKTTGLNWAQYEPTAKKIYEMYRHRGFFSFVGYLYGGYEDHYLRERGGNPGMPPRVSNGVVFSLAGATHLISPNLRGVPCTGGKTGRNPFGQPSLACGPTAPNIHCRRMGNWYQERCTGCGILGIGDSQQYDVSQGEHFSYVYGAGVEYVGFPGVSPACTTWWIGVDNGYWDSWVLDFYATDHYEISSLDNNNPHEVDNDFATRHNISVAEVQFKLKNSLDGAISSSDNRVRDVVIDANSSGVLGHRRLSEVIVKKSDYVSGAGLRFRIKNDFFDCSYEDDFNLSFDFDSTVSDFDILYQQYLPSIQDENPTQLTEDEVGEIAGYLIDFNYWYQILGDLFIENPDGEDIKIIDDEIVVGDIVTDAYFYVDPSGNINGPFSSSGFVFTLPDFVVADTVNFTFDGLGWTLLNLFYLNIDIDQDEFSVIGTAVGGHQCFKREFGARHTYDNTFPDAVFTDWDVSRIDIRDCPATKLLHENVGFGLDPGNKVEYSVSVDIELVPGHWSYYSYGSNPCNTPSPQISDTPLGNCIYWVDASSPPGITSSVFKKIDDPPETINVTLNGSYREEPSDRWDNQYVKISEEFSNAGHTDVFVGLGVVSDSILISYAKIVDRFSCGNLPTLNFTSSDRVFSYQGQCNNTTRELDMFIATKVEVEKSTKYGIPDTEDYQDLISQVENILSTITYDFREYGGDYGPQIVFGDDCPPLITFTNDQPPLEDKSFQIDNYGCDHSVNRAQSLLDELSLPIGFGLRSAWLEYIGSNLCSIVRDFPDVEGDAFKFKYENLENDLCVEYRPELLPPDIIEDDPQTCFHDSASLIDDCINVRIRNHFKKSSIEDYSFTIGPRS